MHDRAPAVTPDEPQPLAQQIYRILLSRLITSDIEPGSKITIDSAARELGVSPTPVREALSRLELNGLVVRHLNAGYRVAPQLTREQFENLTEIRLALEPIAARRAALYMSRTAIVELQAIADRMSRPEERSERGLYATFAQDDSEFHDAIALGGGNDMIRTSLARLHIHVRLFRLIYEARIRTDALQEHQAIVDAIKAGDPEGAAYEMRSHIIRSADRFRDAFDKPEAPPPPGT